MRRYILAFLLAIFLALSVTAQPQDEEQTAPISSKNVDTILMEDNEGANTEWNEADIGSFSDNESDDNVYDEAEEDARPLWDLREVDKTAWEKLKQDKRFIYKKEKPVKEKKKRTVNFDFWGFFNSSFFKMLLYLAFACFLLYVIHLFVKNNNISFSRNVKDKPTVEEEKPWEDLRQFEDWEVALQKAIGEKDYRLATRIYYLHTLNLLNKATIINYRDDKTNWYYVQKLYGGLYHDGFQHLTTIFDYVWYGEYALSEEQFSQLQAEFQNFHFKIKE